MGSTVGFCSFCTQHEIARFSLSRPSLPLSLKPRQRLTPISSTEATVLATTDTVRATVFTTARGRLRLGPRLRLSPTTATTDWDTTATVLATTDTVWATVSTTARGRPRLSLSPTTATTDLDWATVLATGPTATAVDFTTARGRLRPSPRLRLSPTTTVDTDTDSV